MPTTTGPRASRQRTPIDMVALITAKRDGDTLAAEQIEELVTGYVRGLVPDYQMSALLMAVVFQGLDATETLALTEAMVRSGATMDLSSLGRRIVDKHSTGGVGDKVSLALGPVVAACGVPFAKMSGRGLGHTGGTLDKLESIPGFRVELSQEQFLRQVGKIGIAIAGQTSNIVPADKQLYALRDVTGTVESMPLIAASIMSKKLASGADAIVLDVKVGSGAFMKDLDHARELARAMIAIGEGAGREVKVLITDMATPLGNAVGNAIEIREVTELLQGRGPDDLRELVVTAAGMLLALSDLGIDEATARDRASAALAEGTAWQTWRTWIAAQGGDPDAQLELAPVEHTLLAAEGGRVTQLDALTVGLAAARLGAGRRQQGDAVDHGVGIELHTSVGARIGAGEPLLTVYARNEEQAHEAARAVADATTITPTATASRHPRSVVLERLG